MPAIQQIACFVAVAAPFLVILATNLFLAVLGERGTLLLPGLQGYPRVELDDEPTPQTCAEEPALVEEPLRKAA